MNRAKSGGYEDIAKATEALKWMINKIEAELNQCLNVENGKCNMTYRHEDCRILMNLLYDLTEDSKYKSDY